MCVTQTLSGNLWYILHMDNFNSTRRARPGFFRPKIYILQFHREDAATLWAIHLIRRLLFALALRPVAPPLLIRPRRHRTRSRPKPVVEARDQIRRGPGQRIPRGRRRRSAERRDADPTRTEFTTRRPRDEERARPRSTCLGRTGVSGSAFSD